MSYYRSSYQSPMGRGRGYQSRGYRGSSDRGGWRGRGGGGYAPRGGNRYNDSFESFNSSKYSNSNRYSGGDSRPHDDYRRSYRQESSYGSSRDGLHRSPERKRIRTEAPSSRHESSYGGYGSSRYESGYSDRRSFSNDRHPSSLSRRDDDFRRPGPPRGGYRGRFNSRGIRGLRFSRDRPIRRRLLESSYAVHKRFIPSRSTDFARRLKISKMRSAIAARLNDDDEDEDNEEQSGEEKEAAENGAEKAEGEKVEGAEGESPKKAADGEAKAKGEKTDPESGFKKTFIKLHCPHCNIKAITFRRYEYHLLGRTHALAMRRIASKQKSILSQMRMAQRSAQNELEKSTDEELTTRTNFCPVCKLNYRQSRADHVTSDSHKNMKKFLMPFCKICSITFKSPMIYESHCCSIEHLKRKQRVENGNESDGADEETNLDNFTTIDSVGVDEDEDKKDKKEKKEILNVGIEQIRKVEAHYCDLCKMYVGRGSDEEMPAILTRHCKMRTHMQRYIRFKEDKALEKHAQKLQRKETADKKTDVKKEEGDEAAQVEPKDEEMKEEPTNAKTDDEETREDKLWADVDKDLDDILAKEGTKSEDEDEEETGGERYDRFKYSEKNGDEKVLKTDADDAEKPAEAAAAEVAVEK